MRVTASNVQPGDRVRGIGLVAEYVEPQTDFTTSISGYVSQKHEDGGQTFHTSIILPNEHLVNVARSDAAFRADQIERVVDVLQQWEDGELDDEETVNGLAGIVWADRSHRYLGHDVIAERFASYAFDSGLNASAMYEHLVGEADNSSEGHATQV